MSTLKSEIDKAEREIDKRARVMVSDSGIEINGIFYPLERPVYNLIVDAIRSNQVLVDRVEQYRRFIIENHIKPYVA